MSAAEARRAALAAQGFAAPRPGALGRRVTRGHFAAVLDRLGAVQIDTVNVLARAHLLTFFARLGPYDPEALGRWLHDSGEVFEYWAHAASFVPADLQPAFRPKMAAALDGEMYSGLARLAREEPDFVDGVRRAVLEQGPVLPVDLRPPGTRKKGQWWDWDDTKRALELLFWAGEITATRGRQFERVYDAFERVLPAAVLDQPTPTTEEARRVLLGRAASAMGVATTKQLADYFRMGPTKARPVVEAMAADGELEEVRVEGWAKPAYRWPAARVPRRVEARALLAPFDSLVWERDRAEDLFGFHYRIEIYVPAPKRVHGYYVLPFLLGDDLVGRVDLKADRAGRRLLVRSAWAEPDADHDEVASALAAELHLLAGFLGLDDVVVEDRGDLAPALAHAAG